MRVALTDIRLVDTAPPCICSASPLCGHAGGTASKGTDPTSFSVR